MKPVRPLEKALTFRDDNGYPQPPLAVGKRPLNGGEPTRAGGAPSYVGWCSYAWRDALPEVAGPPGPGSFLL